MLSSNVLPDYFSYSPRNVEMIKVVRHLLRVEQKIQPTRGYNFADGIPPSFVHIPMPMGYF